MPATKPYQDEWLKGKVARKGYRPCAKRFAVVREALEGLRRPFTVLDMGASAGYFSMRLAGEMGAVCTAVDSGESLPRVVEANGDAQVTVVNRRLSLPEIASLGTFDVVLALSVLHHLTDWRAGLEVLRGAARSALIIETPAPTEQLRQAVGRAYLREMDATLAELGQRVGEGSGVWDKKERRGIYRVPGFPLLLTGAVFTGGGNHRGHAQRFTQDLGARLGYEPYAGSLNLRLRGLAGPVREALGPPAVDFQDETRPGRGRHGGDYQLWPARLQGQECHVVIPGRRGHGPDSVELVAPVRLRDALSLADDDEVQVEVGA